MRQRCGHDVLQGTPPGAAVANPSGSSPEAGAIVERGAIEFV